ncbi:MAG TPA: hypothetical protein G4O20_07935 [Dehalococcoidia bacterium]|nr:hypothetical protein [Dehalococcoidia bacterium]
MEKKFYLLIALLVILLVSGGMYAYTYTTAFGTIGTSTPTGDIATVNATPSQPDWDDVLTTVNEDIIFRPVGAGDETEIKSQYPDSGEHWAKVDETTSDNDTTYVYTPSNAWEEDLYNTANHSTQTVGGDIQYVEVFMVARAALSADQDSAYIHIKTNGFEHNGATENLTTSYAIYSNQWIDNPQSGSSWNWNEIDNLQTGIGIREAGVGKDSLCTQVYTNVNFDAPELNGNTPTGDLFEIDVDSNYTGNLQVRVYLTNTDALLKAYDSLSMYLYLESSEEAGETPDYQIMNLQNGTVTFNLVGISGGSYTLSVTGGTYQLFSREVSEWETGWAVTPELYCEAEQR